MIVIKMLFFGIIGILVELVYKAFKNMLINKDWSLTGEVSLLMIPIYGLIIFIFPYVKYKLSSFGLLIRGLGYVVVFFVIQYLVGWILNKFKMCPWSYSGKLAFGDGIISLTMLPAFFIAGILVEHFYPIIIRLYSAI